MKTKTKTSKPTYERRAVQRFYGYRWTVREGRSNRIGEVTVFPVDGSRTSRDVWELTDLQVHPACRGQGYAYSLLRMVCRWADRAGISIRLYVLPYTGTSTGNITRAEANTPDAVKLMRLYSAWGWRSTSRRAFGGGHPTMLRLPNKHELPLNRL
jgi:GNAT superfamily N-acetyltransferase